MSQLSLDRRRNLFLERRSTDDVFIRLAPILASPDQEIPKELLEKAYGVAVIPNVVKGAFLAGGRFGKGLVAARGENGQWGTPLFERTVPDQMGRPAPRGVGQRRRHRADRDRQ